jgi:GNAT superfamily N-acetyltransferase
MIRVFEDDFGYGYLPQHHADADDLKGTYLDRPSHALLVAVDDGTGAVIGMAGVKPIRTGICPDAPRSVVERYDRPGVAELVRVYVDRSHRKAGVGHALVEAARAHVRSVPAYHTLFLHTDATYPGALDFWRRHGTEIAPGDTTRDGVTTRFFEIPLAATPGDGR